MIKKVRLGWIRLGVDPVSSFFKTFLVSADDIGFKLNLIEQIIDNYSNQPQNV